MAVLLAMDAFRVRKLTLSADQTMRAAIDQLQLVLHNPKSLNTKVVMQCRAASVVASIVFRRGAILSVNNSSSALA